MLCNLLPVSGYIMDHYTINGRFLAIVSLDSVPRGGRGMKNAACHGKNVRQLHPRVSSA